MNIKVTARHFKAHETILGYATDAVEGLGRFYDGIIKADVILSFEKVQKSTKKAEVSVKVYNAVLTGTAEAEEFEKSIDAAVTKVQAQLKKYKERMHAHDRVKVRKARAKE